MGWYRSGTVNVTNGSNAIVGASTGWQANGVKTGDIFTADNVTLYEISGITDDGHITLDRAYTGTTGTGASYAIIQNLSPSTTAQLNALVAATTALTTTNGQIGTLGKQAASSAVITGGTIDNTTIGGTTKAPGSFTTLTVTGNAAVGGNATVAGTQTVTGALSAGSINGTPIGNVTPGAGAFTTLSASAAATIAGNATVGGSVTVGAAIAATGNITSGGTVLGTGGYFSNEGTGLNYLVRVGQHTTTNPKYLILGMNPAAGQAIIQATQENVGFNQALALQPSGGSTLIGDSATDLGYLLTVKGNNGNSVAIDNDGSPFTVLDFFHGGSEMAAIIFDHDNNQFVFRNDNSGGSVSFGGAGGGNLYTGGVGTQLTWSGSSITVATTIKPISDNTLPLGGADARFSVFYAGTGAINTSDGTQKTIRGDGSLLDAEKLVAADLLPLIKVFQWNDAVAAKGADKARLHFGWIAQDVEAAFAARELNGFDYGLLCMDEVIDYVETIETQPVRQHKTQSVTRLVTSINVIDGVPVQTTASVTKDEPIYTQVAVVDGNGVPVTVAELQPVLDAAGRPVLDEDDKPTFTTVQVPLVHPVAVMETVDKQVTVRTAQPARQQLGLRYDEAITFVLTHLAASIPPSSPPA